MPNYASSVHPHSHSMICNVGCLVNNWFEGFYLFGIWGKCMRQPSLQLQVGTDQNGRDLVKVDPAYFRPAEVETLLG